MTPHPFAEILRAIADGKQIQFRSDPGEIWQVPTSQASVLIWIYTGRYQPDQLRIKPEPKKARYRVAEMRSFFHLHESYANIVDTPGQALCLENKPNFIRWLTDWIEYEVSE